MEKNEIKITKQKFKSFIKAFNDLEITIENYYKKAKENKISRDNGYLVDKKKIDKIKEKLSYSELKIYINDDTKFKKKLEEKYKNINEIVCETCEQKIFESSKDFIQSISNHNEYEIIDKTIWMMINNGKLKENEGKIFYEINENNLLLSFNSDKVYFSLSNSNVLKSKNLLLNNGNQTSDKKNVTMDGRNSNNFAKKYGNNNYNNLYPENLSLDDLYQSLIEFTKFENLLIDKLKSNYNIIIEQYEGYFIEKNWFHNWKMCTNYDKNKYKIKEGDNEENIEIIKNSINIALKQKLTQINILTYFNINSYQSILTTDVIALVNDKFLSIFTKKLENFERYKSKFTITNHQLIFANNHNQKYNIYSFNNILPITSNECFIIANNLIELYFFYETLKLNPSQVFQYGTNFILVDKNWIHNYKKKYSYDKICESIKDKDKEKILNIILKNEMKEKLVLNEIISEFNWEFFHDIYKVNQQNNDENYHLEFLEINSNNANEKIQYINNFELIDKNIFNKLNIKDDIKNKISKIASVRNYKDNKILIQYEIGTNKIYIIGYINKNNNTFISEYLIKSYNNDELDNFLKEQGISGIITNGNNNFEIISNHNSIGKIYKIKMEGNENEVKNEKEIKYINKSNLKNIKNFESYIKLLLYLYKNDEKINYKKSQKLEAEFEIFYIVSKNLIKKFKSILNFTEFEKYVKDNDINKIYINNNFNDDCLNKLPKTLLDSLYLIDTKKLNELKNEKLNKISLTLSNQIQLCYYRDFEFISADLVNYLQTNNIYLKDIVKAKCLFENNKIIFYQENQINNILNVARINDNNEFISELILFYKNPGDINKFINEMKKIGYDNMISSLLLKNGENNMIENPSSFPIDIAYKINDEINGNQLPNDIKEQIFIIIKIYLFNLDLKNNIDLSINNAGRSNSENYSKTFSCQLINKTFLDQFKKYYLYEELFNYLKDDNVKKKLNIFYEKKQNSEEIVQKIFNEIKDNSNFFNRYYSMKLYDLDEKLTKPEEKILEINDDNFKKNTIKYYDNFSIINSDISHLMFKNKKTIIEKEKEFIINIGKIIIQLNYYPMNQLLMCYLDDNFNVINSELVYFGDNTFYISFNFEKLKKKSVNEYLKEIRKNKCKILENNKTKEIGLLYSFNNNENNNKNEDDNTNDIIQNLIKLFFNIDKFNFQIKDDNIKISYRNNYYLINKEWMNYLNKCYNFDKISNIIKEEKNRKYIEDYRKCIENSLNNGIIEDIIAQIPEQIKSDINNKNKQYDINLFCILETANKFEENKCIPYYENFFLINEEIKIILEEKLNFINTKFDITAKCFIDYKSIFMFYELKNNLIMSLGRLNEKDIYENNIIIIFYKNKDYEYYKEQIIIKTKIPNAINQIMDGQNHIKKLKNENNQDIGNILILNYFKKESNNSEIGINPMIKEDIKILIKYYIFNQKLKKYFEITKKDNIKPIPYKSDFYLINSNVFDIFKNHYNYGKIIQYLDKKIKNYSSYNDNSFINYIYKTLIKDNSFNQQFIQKSNSVFEFNQNLFEIEYSNLDNNNKNINLVYPNNFEIVDENIYNYFSKRKGIQLKAFNNKIDEIIINNGEIIMNIINLKEIRTNINIDINEDYNIDDNKNELLLIGHLNNNFKYKYICDALIKKQDEKNWNTLISALKAMKYIKVISKPKLIGNNFIHFIDLTLKNEVEKQQDFEKNQKESKNKDNIIEINGTNQKDEINQFNETIQNDKNIINMINSGKNIIKLFIILYLHYEKLNEIINKEIKHNITNENNEKYYLINKEFMRKYKEYFNYDKIKNTLITSENIKNVFLKNKTRIFDYMKNNGNYECLLDEIVQQFSDGTVLELGQNKLNQNKMLNYWMIDKNFKFSYKKTESGANLAYYEGNEVLNKEFITYFYIIDQQLFNMIEKYEIGTYYIIEKKLFIYLYLQKTQYNREYHYLDIGQISNNIFTTNLIIYFSAQSFMFSLINKINRGSFKTFLGAHYKDIIEKGISIIMNNDRIDGKILKVKDFPFNEYNVIKPKEILFHELNPNSQKILLLIIYYSKFVYDVQNKKKNNGANISCHLIKSQFKTNLQKTEVYKNIWNYINNNKNINMLLKYHLNVEINSIYDKIIKEFDANAINIINSKNNEIKIYSNENEIDSKYLKLNANNAVYIANNFFILNDEIYNLFIKESSNINIHKGKYYYFINQNYVFVMLDQFQYKNSILVNKLNSKDELELEIILNFNNTENRDNVINQIKFLGYKKYKEFLLFGSDDKVSPIFDTNQNQIGNAYRYIPEITDYSEYNINFEIRKMFLLYFNYYKLLKKIGQNNNTFNEYYIVKKEWIQEYKNYYNFDAISAAIDKSESIQNIFNNMTQNSNGNIIFPDKLIALMMKSLPKDIIKKFNIKEKDSIHFNINQTQPPEMIQFSYENNLLWYIHDFELISADIYHFLFKNFNLNVSLVKNSLRMSKIDTIKADKVECLFSKQRIIIKFLNPNCENKYMIQIGDINQNKVFEAQFLLVYNDLNCLNNHVKNVINSGGFDMYCEFFIKSEVYLTDIKDNDGIINGKAIRMRQNKINNINNNINTINILNININNQAQMWNNMNTIIGQNNIIQSFQNNNQNNDDNIDNNNLKSIKNGFPFPPKVGLCNIGSTCYMNATLQCFCQIEEFANYFKYDDYVNEVIVKIAYGEDKKCLTESFKLLIEEIWPEKDKYDQYKKREFAPEEFRKKIADMSPLFEKMEANDAKDLVNFIIMTLHEELNQSLSGNNVNGMNNNLFNKNQAELVFKNFYEEYERAFRSKISELFYAIMQTTTECLSCHDKQYNFQAYFFLVFPLEEVKKYSISQICMNTMNKSMPIMNNFMNNNMMMNGFNNNMMMNNFNFNNNMIQSNPSGNFNAMNNMNFAFNSGQINQIFMNPMQNNMGIITMNNFNGINNFNVMNNFNMMNNNDAIKLQKLNNNIVSIEDCFIYNEKKEFFKDANQIYCNHCHQMSNAEYFSTLTTNPKILILLLNRGVGIQFKIKLEFTTELDISRFVNFNDKSRKYKLIGVITHLGESGAGGHFIAHCLSPVDGEWYTYNDAIVSKCDNFKKNIIDLGMPYLLFYQRID